MKTSTFNHRHAWGEAKFLQGMRVEFTYNGIHEKMNAFIGSTSQEEVAPGVYAFELDLFEHEDDPYMTDYVTLSWEELSTLRDTGEVAASDGYLKLLDN